MASITLEARQSLVALYVGMFQAAPGATTLGTMVQSYESGKTLKEIAKDLDSASFRTQYPAFLTADEFASRLVSRLLGSDVGEAQTTWATNWVKNKLTSGVADTDVIVEAVNALRATANTNYDTAKATLTNKVTVAEYYSVEKALSSDSLATLQSVISSVTSDAATVDSAKSSVDNTATTASTVTATLTDKIDSVSDAGTVKGVISSVSGDTTWGVADSVKGAAGASIFELTGVVGDAISTAGRSTSGLETFNITFVDGDTGNGEALTIDATTLTDSTTFEVVSATASANDSVVYTGLKAQTVAFSSDDSDLDTSLTYATGTTASSIALKGTSLDAVTVNSDVTSVSIASTGAANKTGTINAANDKVTTLTITGDQKLTSTFDGFNTSASALKVDTSGTTGETNLTLTGALTDKTQLVGGTGVETIVTNGASTLTSNFKSADVDKILFASGTSTVDVTGVTGGSLGIKTGATGITLNKVADGYTTYAVGGGTTSSSSIGTITLSVDGASSSAQAAGVTFEINNGGVALAATSSLTVGNLTVPNTKAVTLNVADGAATVGDIIADTVETITLKASGNLTVTNAIGATGEPTTIDASGVVGKATITLTDSMTKDVTYTGSSASDVIVLGQQDYTTANHTFTINTGAGADTLTLPNDAAANAKGKFVISLGEGDDTIKTSGTAGLDSTDSNASHTLDAGAGTDTWEISTANDYSAIDAIEGVEKATVLANVTLDGGAISGDAIEIANFGVTITIAGDSSDSTIDASKLTFIGNNTALTITAATGATITGNKGVDTITGSSNVDTITGGEGADVIKGQGGNDTINLSETTQTADVVILGAGTDTINNFDVDNSGSDDDFRVDVSEIEAATSGDLIQLAGSSVGDTEAVSLLTITGATDLDSKTNNYLVANLAGNIASTDALETALEASGDLALTTTGAEAVNDVFLVLYDDGTDSYLAAVKIGATSADSETWSTGELTATNVAKFAGISDVSTITADDILAFVA